MNISAACLQAGTAVHEEHFLWALEESTKHQFEGLQLASELQET